MKSNFLIKHSKLIRFLIRCYFLLLIILPFYIFIIKISHNFLYYLGNLSGITNAVVMATIIQFLLIIILQKKIKIKIINTIDRLNTLNFIIIVVLSILSSVIILFRYSVSEFINISGDGKIHLNIIKDMIKFDQNLFQLTYTHNKSYVQGLFYPVVGHYFPAMLSNTFNIEINFAYYLCNIFLVSFMYPAYLLLFINSNSNSIISYYLTLLSFLSTIFPFNFLLTQNYAQLFSNVILFLFIFLLKILKNEIKIKLYLIYISIFSLILLLSHPTSLISFLLFIYVTFIERKQIMVELKKISNQKIALGVLNLIFLLILVNLKQLFLSYISTFAKLNYSLDLSGTSIIYRIYKNLLKYLLFLSGDELKFPFFILVFVIIILNLKINKEINLKLKRAFIFYIISYIILFSSILSSFPSILSKISIFSFFYYESPARITHLIILANFYLLSVLLFSSCRSKIFTFLGVYINKIYIKILFSVSILVSFYFNIV